MHCCIVCLIKQKVTEFACFEDQYSKSLVRYCRILNTRHCVFNFSVKKNTSNECLCDSAITLWGDTLNITSPELNDTNDWVKTTMGPDGTNGNQPRMINIVSNYVHELGISEKQSSFYFQAKSCSNYIYGNIFYNGPRAGINFNDGFGGNSTILKNLVFNTCRESGDHGPFNSWDRQVYVTKVRNGTASTIKAFDHITQNFIIANYQSRWAVGMSLFFCILFTVISYMI